MAQFFTIHPQSPQQRLIYQAANIVRHGGVIVYPTDSCYALGCQLGNKEAVERIRHLRQLNDKHHLTLLCRHLSELSVYAKIDNTQYRLIKAATPGSYTFILPASREVPRRLQHPKRSTIGLRIPDNKIVLALLEALGEPLLSASLILPDSEFPLSEVEEIQERLKKSVDLIIDGGSGGLIPTTVVDLTEGAPNILRMGNGTITPFGL